MRWPTEPRYPVSRGALEHVADGQGEAVDIAAPYWTPLYPVHRAYITRTFYDSEQAGYAVDYAWSDEEGRHEVRYAHMIEEAIVDIGTWVDETTLLGYVGSTGNSTGPHVHLYELINGVRVDPEANCLREEETMPSIIDSLNLIWEKLSAIQEASTDPAITQWAEDAKMNGVVPIKIVIGIQ